MFRNGDTLREVWLDETTRVLVRVEQYKLGKHHGWWVIPSSTNVFAPAEVCDPYKDFLFCGRLVRAFPRKANGLLW